MMLEVEKIMKAILTINSDAKVYVKMNTENTLATAEIEFANAALEIVQFNRTWIKQHKK